MRKKIVVNFIIMVLCIITLCPRPIEVNAASSTASINILFIGNSKTYFNNMPKMLNNMISASGKKNVYKVLVKGSHSLNFHYNYIFENEDEIKSLFKKKIHFVILNEQTDVQINKMYDSKNEYDYKHILGNISDDAVAILNRLSEYGMIDSSTRVILNATWNYSNLDNAELAKSNKNFKKTRTAIKNAGYKNCFIAYTGNAIKAVNDEMNKTKKRKFSKQKLFSDERHVTPVGSYIEALVLYKAMFQQNMTANYGGRITDKGMQNSRDNYVEIYNYQYLEFVYSNVEEFMRRAFNRSSIENMKDYKKIRDFINSKKYYN